MRRSGWASMRGPLAGLIEAIDGERIDAEHIDGGYAKRALAVRFWLPAGPLTGKTLVRFCWSAVACAQSGLDDAEP